MITMNSLVWLPVVFFMIHEFEEIIMIEAWSLRYRERIETIWPKRKPFGLDFVNNNITASISIGISCEFILTVAVCLFTAISQYYLVWYGFVVGSIISTLPLHLNVCIKFKNYAPGIITSAIILIPTLWLLYQAETMLHYGVLEIVLSTILVNFAGAFLTFKFLHKSMVSWSKKLSDYSRVEAGQDSGQTER